MSSIHEQTISTDNTISTMNIAEIQATLEKAYCALDLERKIVGVSFLFDSDEFERADARPPAARMPYCVMVKRAMLGNSIKALFDDFGCRASARALGIMDTDEFFSSGRHYRKLGLYHDLVIAKNIRQNMTICRHRAHGVMIKPLEACTQAPDVVLLACNPYQAMRVVQAYTYQFGYHTHFKMSGNQAICSECTAYPFESNSINISMLCAGTRHMAGWRDEELAIGFPFHFFLPIVEGLYATVNPIEPDRKKVGIEARLMERNRNDLQLEYGKNYYSGLYLTQKGTSK